MAGGLVGDRPASGIGSANDVSASADVGSSGEAAAGTARSRSSSARQQRLYFLPLPQWQGSFRPIFVFNLFVSGMDRATDGTSGLLSVRSSPPRAKVMDRSGRRKRERTPKGFHWTASRLWLAAGPSTGEGPTQFPAARAVGPAARQGRLAISSGWARVASVLATRCVQRAGPSGKFLGFIARLG